MYIMFQINRTSYQKYFSKKPSKLPYTDPHLPGLNKSRQVTQHEALAVHSTITPKLATFSQKCRFSLDKMYNSFVYINFLPVAIVSESVHSFLRI